MDFRLLGPLEVVGDDGVALSVRAGRERALLALLILRANELVASDRLVEELWGDSRPRTAHRMLHNQVSSLRRELGRNGRLETRGSAYRLNVGPGERDVDRFEQLVARGRAEVDGDPEHAAATFREALALWRGPPLSDLAYEPFAQAEIARLEERRWAAFEARVEAELLLGAHADVVSELEAAIAEQPLRERIRGQLMLALYRCGRQAEALEAYRAARRTLVEEVGVEPGSDLRALHAAILEQDPALDRPPGPTQLPAPLESDSPPLVGRESELAALLSLLSDACDGRGHVVSISGPPGIGKTRLAAEVAKDAARRRMAVLYADADTPPGVALAAAKDGARPTLLVLDDGASREVLDRGAAFAGWRLLVLVLARGLEPVSAEHRIELGTLADHAVAEIAQLYLPDDPESIAAVVAESGGVPLTAHRAAARHARARAAGQIGANAGRTATERANLRSAESALSDDLIALRGLEDRERQVAGLREGVPLPVVCPFPGLATFDLAHVQYFFGRERLVAELVTRLVGTPILAVVGPSGSGKSSAVRAGLLPALADGVLPGSGGWRRALMRPGAHPLAELERTLPAADERAVLVVDQFEELFAVCREERERSAFLDALVTLAQDRRVQVVVAMRADFYGRCAEHARFARLIAPNQVLVGPMQPDELRRAIEEPARRVGLSVEPSLTEALIADVLDEPGGLPMLSAALLEQWRERDGRSMRRTTYDRTGGVRGAVGRLAERTYEQMSADEREAARRILLRLADAGEHDAAFVRRQVPLDELDADEHTAAALSALIDSRLVTVDEHTLEVAHEALLREWPRLRSWLEEDAEGRRLHQHLMHAARDWQAADRERGELYRGARLAAALEWAAGHAGDLNERERDFLDASRAEIEQESEHQRRTNRRLRSLLVGLALLLALAVWAGVVALNQRGEARDAALAADAQRLGVEALNEDSLEDALLHARAAVELDESPATEGSLLSVLLRNPAALGIVDQSFGIYGAAISPDGRLMATGDDIGDVVVYDAATRAQVGRYEVASGLIQNVKFSPDGDILAVSYMDRSLPVQRSGLVDLIDPRTQELQQRVRLPPLPEPAPWVSSDVVFLPNGRDLLVRAIYGESPDGPAAPIYRVDRETGAAPDPLQLGRHASSLNASATSDGKVFVTSMGDNKTWALDPERLRIDRSWPVGDSDGAVAPDGRLFALGSMTGKVRLLDLSSGEVRRLQGGHKGRVLRMRFTPDGATLVTTGVDGQVLLWDMEREAIAERLDAHDDEINGLDLTADGRTLISGSTDTRAILWDIGGDRRLDRRFFLGKPFDVQFAARGIAVSPDGRTLALTQSDGDVDLLDTATLRRRGGFPAMTGAALAVAFSPDGRLLAVTGLGGRVALFDTRTLAGVGDLKGVTSVSPYVAFSPNGKLLAAAEANPSGPFAPAPLHVWDVRTRKQTDFSGHSALGSVAFSPDRKLIAAAAGTLGTEIREVDSGRLIKQVVTDDSPRTVAFSPDGKLLFIGRYDGGGQLFSTTSWERVGRPLPAHGGRINSAMFTPDSGTLVTAAADGTAVLTDVKTQRRIGPPLQLAPSTYATAALSPDGSRLFAVSTRGEGISFDMSPESWKQHACLVAGRDLTAAEWTSALPGQPYRAVCSSSD